MNHDQKDTLGTHLQNKMTRKGYFVSKNSQFGRNISGFITESGQWY